MTVLRAGWGPILARRQQGLSKMLAYSVFLHVFLFLFILLNRTFFGPPPPSFRGFQVSLVTPAGGVFTSSGMKGSPQGKVSKSGKNKGKKKSTSSSLKKKASKGLAPPPPPKLAAPKAASKPSPKSPAPRSGQKKAAALAPVRTPRTSVNASSPPQDDPEQLQEWWKKQQKNLKLPSSQTARKPKMGTSKRTRTAKIDIQKRPIVSLPLIEPGTSQSKPKDLPHNNTAATVKAEEANLEAPFKDNLATQESSEAESSNGAQGASEAIGETESSAGSLESLHAAVAPGIKGLDVGGGSSFLFPGYLQKIDHKIRWRWAPPPVSSVGDRLVIRFVIEKNGGIDKASVEIEESSGNHFFDQSALRAVLAAHPLPPLPKSFNGKILTVFMNFVVSEDS